MSFEKRLHGAIRAKADELGALVHAVGGTGDHVHLVAPVPPAASLAQFVGQVKGASSQLANHPLYCQEQRWTHAQKHGIFRLSQGAPSD